MFPAFGVVGLATLALWIFCIFDVLLSEDSSIRNLPKITWLFLVVILPAIGSIAWLVAGRPVGAGAFPGGERPQGSARTMPYRGDAPPHWRAQAPAGPEDSSQYKRDLEEHRRLLNQWEEDLRRREDELRKRQQGEAEPPQP